jgi:hypothetical protein
MRMPPIPSPRAARPLGLAAAALLVSLLAPAAARADVCWLGFRPGSTPVVDGTRGAEWNDATVLDSGNGCINHLLDGQAAPYVSRAVRVYTKRSATHLYFLFEVGDATQSLGAPGTSLGEKLVLQLDANHNRSATIEAGGGDHRYELTHRWNTGVGVTRTHFASGPTTGFCPGENDWVGAPLGGADIQFSTSIQGGASGYTVEVGIPLADVGLGGGLGPDLGVAFALVNDLGNGTDYAGSRFPQGLPFTTQMNGLLAPGAEQDPAGCNDWLHPVAWGGGFYNAAPTDVTFSHAPVYWLADAVQALNCANVAGYEYFPVLPCKVKVQATVNNSGGATRRNLLYLWGDHDAGAVRWTFMDLKEDVNLAPGNVTTESDLFNTPKNLIAHPCIRVYVLPNVYRADFDEATIRALVQAPNAIITQFEAAYGVQPVHSAQRNITRVTDGRSCAQGNCPSTALRATARPLYASLTGNRPWSFLEPRPLFAEELQPRPDTTPREVLDSTVQNGVLWSPADRERFGKGNVAVQIRTLGWEHPRAGARHDYHIIEDIGGVLQLFPLDLVREGERPVRVKVSSPSDKTPYTLWLQVDQAAPAGVKVNVRLDTRPQEFRPGETREVAGAVAGGGAAPVATDSTATGGDKKCGLGGAGTVVVLLGLALLGLARRSWTNDG